MAVTNISNIFDPELRVCVDTGRCYAAGDEHCFTDNRIIADVKSQVAAMVPGADLVAKTSVYAWTHTFCYDVEISLFCKNIYGHKQGFTVKLAYERTMNRCDKYTVSLIAESAKSNIWDTQIMPNRAKAFRGKALPSSSDKSLTFVDPSAELIRDFVNALVTSNRRKALADFIDGAKKAAMESVNTKTALAIESVDILPEIEQIARKSCMGIPDVVDEPNCRKIKLLTGQYGCMLVLTMYKDFMEFGIRSGSDYNSNDFDTNFIRMLNCSLARYNIYAGTQIGYDRKELVFDMARRIGECYGAVRMAMGEAWHGIDKKWKLNSEK